MRDVSFFSALFLLGFGFVIPLALALELVEPLGLPGGFFVPDVEARRGGLNGFGGIVWLELIFRK
jgi:hypothetical protein